MATYYVATTGSNDNSGSSETVKVSGTLATTNATATVQLDAGSNLSTVTPNVDTIRIASRTDGIRTTNIYLITAVDDGLDQVTVSPSPGVASGQAWTIGGPWQTIDRSADVNQAGDIVYVKATASYNEAAAFPSGAVGSSSGSCVWEGYTTTPGDNGIVTMDGTNTLANAITLPAGSCHMVFRNFRFTDYTGTGFGNNTSSNLVNCIRCRADSNGGSGFLLGNACVFLQCKSDTNSNNGFQLNPTVGSGFCAFCTSETNGGDGFNMSAGGVCFSCISFSNATDNFELGGVSNILINCTSDGDAKDSDNAFRFSGASELQVQALINCIAYDCTTGVTAATSQENRIISYNNLVNSNTTAYSNYSTIAGEVTSAPSFVNEGTGDYGLSGASPAKDAGISLKDNPWGNSYTGSDDDIGAIQAGGGSGGGSGSGILTGGKM